jgi:hypothetical protein
MRRSILGLVAAVILLVGPAGLRAQQQAQFLMPMFDDKGAPVKSFAPADLSVFEDGKPAKVVKVEPKVSPMNVTLALDNGRGMNDVLVHVKTAAKTFINTIPTGVDVALMTTAPQPRYVVKATKNKEQLLKSVDSIGPEQSAGARTIEGIRDVSDTWKKLPVGETTLVLVILGSTYSPEFVAKKDLEDAFSQVAAARGVVHSVIFKPSNATEGDAQLETAERFAQNTRGRFEAIGSYLQLTVLEDIAKDLAKAATGGQFLITIERPAGATGKLGSLSMSPSNGLDPGRITRLP